ncbi:MAG: response regulator transcription factor, partial [Fimbriimonadales bacterium]|nr:response regulator transcription factor [Fimbriimonadales bacterium]
STRPDTIKVVLADQHQLSLEGLLPILKSAKGLHLVGATSHPQEALKLIRETRPDIFVADDRTVEQLGEKAFSQLAEELPDLKLLIITEKERAPKAYATAPRELFGVVYRQDPPTTLMEAIETIGEGNSWRMPEPPPPPKRGRPPASGLSPRESQIVDLIAYGYPNRQIAQRLRVSEQSVKNLGSRILKKLGLENRTQVAIWRWITMREEQEKASSKPSESEE